MEARMMSTDTPRRALTTRAMRRTLIVQFDTALVPEPVASTLSYHGVAMVTWPVWQRQSRGRWEYSDGRVWVCGPRHGWLQLGIPAEEARGY